MVPRLLIIIAVVLGACLTVENLSTTLNLTVKDEALEIGGIINSRAHGQFARLIEDNPQVERIVFGDIDGSTDGDAVAEIGYLIRDLGFETELHADSEVYSGGVDLFLAGTSRYVAPGGILGVHEWSTSFGRARGYPRNSSHHEPTRGYIADMLGSDSFYWFTLQAAPFDEVYIMSRADMLRFGILTR